MSSEKMFSEGIPQGSVLALVLLWLCYCSKLVELVARSAPEAGLSFFAVTTDKSLEESSTKLQPALNPVDQKCYSYNFHVWKNANQTFFMQFQKYRNCVKSL